MKKRRSNKLSKPRRAHVLIHRSKMSMPKRVMRTAVILLMRMTLMTMARSFSDVVPNSCQTSLSSKETHRLYHLLSKRVQLYVLQSVQGNHLVKYKSQLPSLRKTLQRRLLVIAKLLINKT